MSDDKDYLTDIHQAHVAVERAQRELTAAVRRARHRRPRPVTWERIAAVIGMTRQGAEYRFRGRR